MLKKNRIWKWRPSFSAAAADVECFWIDVMEIDRAVQKADCLAEAAIYSKHTLKHTVNGF